MRRDWAKVVTKAKKSIEIWQISSLKSMHNEKVPTAEGLLHFCQINHGSKSLKMLSLMKKRKTTNYRLCRNQGIHGKPVPMDRLLAGDVVGLLVKNRSGAPSLRSL